MSEKPSTIKDKYWIFAHPPKTTIKDAVNWFERNALDYVKSGRMYPRDIYSNDMILPQTVEDKTLLKIDHEAIKIAKSRPPISYHILVGKWLIFIERNQIDKVWEKISSTIKSGKLPYNAKVATIKQGPLREDSKHVICIYTPNFLFRDDVRICRTTLKNLGFKARLYYKPDIFTYKNMYRVYGSKINHRYFG